MKLFKKIKTQLSQLISNIYRMFRYDETVGTVVALHSTESVSKIYVKPWYSRETDFTKLVPVATPNPGLYSPGDKVVLHNHHSGLFKRVGLFI